MSMKRLAQRFARGRVLKEVYLYLLLNRRQISCVCIRLCMYNFIKQIANNSNIVKLAQTFLDCNNE